MAFLPSGFDVPKGLRHERFVVRHITVHDVVKDYDAVMTSRDSLWARFGEAWGWPAADLSLEQDLIELAWHQKEGELKRAFNFAILTPDESRLLGCIYVDPPEKQCADADVCWWVRDSEAGTGLEDVVSEQARAWLEREWPFATVRFPGHDISWEEWEALPDI